MDYATKVRRTAACYVDRYGDDAVEFVRQFFLMAHRDGDHAAARVARDIGIAADDLLMSRSEARSG
jgi:hypothetical protein